MNTSLRILITGASRGLGLALAKALSAQGHSLLLDARGEQALHQAVTNLPAKALAVAGDVIDPAHRLQLLEAARDLGGLDVVINNASVLGPSPQPALLDYPLEALAQVLKTNLVAPLALLQTLRPVLSPKLRVLNISSDAGREAYAGWGGYGASKAALEHLSAVLAQEQPEWKVYWVDPGDMNTQMHQEAFPGEDISDRPLPETSVPGLLSLIEQDWPSGAYAARDPLLLRRREAQI